MVTYSLSHLVQPDNQDILGPIQDDEALFLFGLIRVLCIRRVLEVGGLDGYSAANFCAAVGTSGKVYTVDFNEVPTVAACHITIQKDAAQLVAGDLDGLPLDLIFLDCHVYDAQMQLLKNLEQCGIVTRDTVIALHDTALHPDDRVGWGYQIEGGWVHQNVERAIVNALRLDGWEALLLHPPFSRFTPEMPRRHGLAVLSRPTRLL